MFCSPGSFPVVQRVFVHRRKGCVNKRLRQSNRQGAETTIYSRFALAKETWSKIWTKVAENGTPRRRQRPVAESGSKLTSCFVMHPAQFCSAFHPLKVLQKRPFLKEIRCSIIQLSNVGGPSYRGTCIQGSVNTHQKISARNRRAALRQGRKKIAICVPAEVPLGPLQCNMTSFVGRLTTYRGRAHTVHIWWRWLCLVSICQVFVAVFNWVIMKCTQKRCFHLPCVSSSHSAAVRGGVKNGRWFQSKDNVLKDDFGLNKTKKVTGKILWFCQFPFHTALFTQALDSHISKIWFCHGTDHFVLFDLNFWHTHQCSS